MFYACEMCGLEPIDCYECYACLMCGCSCEPEDERPDYDDRDEDYSGFEYIPEPDPEE